MEPIFAEDLCRKMPVNLMGACIVEGKVSRVFLNDMARERFGMDEEKLRQALAEDFQGIVHPEDSARLRLMLYKGRVTGGRFSGVLRLRQKDGTYSWMDFRLQADRRERGICLCMACMDIDAQREAALKLEHTYEDLLGVMNNTPGGVLVFDTKNDREPFLSFASAGMYRLLRGTEAEVMEAYGQQVYEAVHPEDREKVIRTVEDSLRNLSRYQLTFRIHALTGEYILVDAMATVVLVDGRRRIYMAMTYSSTENEAKHLLRHILEAFVRRQYDTICIIDGRQQTMRVLSSNAWANQVYPLEILDYNREIKAILEAYVLPEEQAALWEQVKLPALLEGMEDREDREIFLTIQRKDGTLRYKKFWFSWLDREARQLVFIQSDYTEMHEQEAGQREALRTALRAAEQANVAKSVFLSRMSHDIRTPLSGIIGFTRMILREEQLPDTARERLDKVASSSEYLLSLINDVLEVSRIESGKYSLQKKPFSLSALLDRVESIISTQCEEKGLKFQGMLAAQANRWYMGDALKLQQVLINILGNAVKFTPSGGQVSLAVKEEASYGSKALLRFRMSDTGVGIQPEFLPHIFEAFSQEDSWDPQYVGSGLGLAICRNIVALMDGTIEVQSEPGQGTVFTVELKLDISSGKLAPAVRAAVGKTLPEKAFAGKRVLLAEDHPMNQEIARYVLENLGFQVDTADNGRIACDKLAASPEGWYDAVILDIRMPEMDGLEAARTIRAMQRQYAARLPLIAMSANAFEEDISKSLRSGINAHLTKPVEPKQLMQTLAGYLLKS